MMFTSETTANAILSTLSQEPLLTAKQVYIRSMRMANRPVSYQAVHKHLTALCETKVLDKLNDGRYRISSQWIERTEQFLLEIKRNSIKAPQINEENTPIRELVLRYRKGETA